MTAVVDPICGDLDDLCWAADGWESAAWGSVQDASERTRGQAAAAFASETTGYLPDVRVWKRYVKRWDRQYAWDYYGRERAVEDYQGEHDVAFDVADEHVATEVPDAWEPSYESMPSWEFVHRSHPLAEAVWVCGAKGDMPPRMPAAPAPAPGQKDPPQ